MHEPIDTKFCDVCGKIFESVINYNDHVRKVHVVKEFPCTLCDNKYTLDHALQRHMLTHTQDKFNCDGCTTTFTRIDSLTRHKCKTERLSFECEHCLKVYYNERHLKNHLIAYHEIVDESSLVTCELCSKVFGSIYHYKHHRNRMHNEFKYPCNKCS